MAVRKSFGFGSGSPYRSFTFNENNELIFSKNGPLKIGNIENDGVNVVISNITFVQEGVIVEKTDPATVVFPTNLPVPFYLTANTPDSREIDNISFSFVKRPQDIGENTVLIAEWDGQEWRSLDELSIDSIIKEREVRAKAYDNLGFNTGFRFSPNSDFSEYALTGGQVTDKTGRLVTKDEITFFDAIEADPDYDRIDSIVWRRIADGEDRIGLPILRAGATFDGSTLKQTAAGELESDSEVHRMPKTVVLNNNQIAVFFIEKYGVNGELRVTLYDEDRTTELFSGVLINDGVVSYDVCLSPSGDFDITYVKDRNLFREKRLSSDLSVSLAPTAIDGLPNPVEKVTAVTDYLGNTHIVFLYQLAPEFFTPFYMKLNSGGSISIAAFRLFFNSTVYIDFDLTVDQDLTLHAVFIDAALEQINYSRFNEIGEELAGGGILSDDTFDGSNVIPGDCRAPKVQVSEDSTLYVTWLQDKTPSTRGFVLYFPELEEKTGHKAKLFNLSSPSENILSYDMAVDWQNHGYILFSTNDTTYFMKYFLPELNTRLDGIFTVDSDPRESCSISFDKKGSLFQVLTSVQSGHDPIVGTTEDWKTGSGSFGSEGTFLASNEVAVLKSFLDGLPQIPTTEDIITITNSTVGNDGGYVIEDQREVTIDNQAYIAYRVDAAFDDTEDESGADLQFFALVGNSIDKLKQSAAIQYGFAEVKAEELESDIIAVLVRKSDNSFETWYNNSSTRLDEAVNKTEIILVNSGDINWNASLNNGTLTWSSPFRVIDPFRNAFVIAPGTLDNFTEDQALYITLPRTQFLLEDGDGNNLKVTDTSEFEVGKKAFVSDSDSTGKVGTVTNVGQGEITLDVTVNEFTAVRGAYVVPVDVELRKENRNEGNLKPNSLGEIESRYYVIAYRKDNYIFFRDGGLNLEDGETGQIGDGVSNEVLNFIGAENEADAFPFYTEALGPSIQNTHVIDNESLFKSVKRLDKRNDTIARVNLIDLVRTTLPTTSPASVDGINIVNGVVVFFPKIGNGRVYRADVSGSTINWQPLAVFGEGDTDANNGSTVKVVGGVTAYLKTIWERSSDLWKPVQLAEATDEPSGFKFDDLDQSELSFNDATRTFTISPTLTHFDYFNQGRVYRKDTPQSIQIPDVEGQHFIYFDGEDLVSVLGFDLEIISRKAYVSNLYWDKANQKAIILGEERHGITMDGTTHAYLHNTRGTRLKEGFGLGSFELGGDGSDNEDAQISLADGVLYDEDLRLAISDSPTPTGRLEQTLSPVAQIPVYYRDGSSGDWRRDDATNFPVKQGSNRIQYNSFSYSVWQQVDVPQDGQHMAMWVFATNNINEPIIAILGQNVWDTLSEAQEQAAFSSLFLGDLPFVEFKLLHRLIYETDSSFSNTSKAALRDVQDLRISPDTPFPSVSPNDHGLLSGLDDPDHGPRAVTTEGVVKDGGLSEADDDVAEALDTLNKLLGQLRIKPHPSNPQRVVITGASRFLNNNTTIIQELGNLVLEFEGAEIDLSTGQIFESNGTTPLGDPFVPQSVPNGEYLNYSITLLPSEANETLNTIKGQIVILAAPDTNVVKIDAPKPPFANGTKLGYVTVRGDSGSIGAINEDDIHLLGTGGGGSGGSGDASSLETRMLDDGTLSNYKKLTPVIFSQAEEEFTDEAESEASYSLISRVYQFDQIGDRWTSSDLLDTEVLNENNIDITEIFAAFYQIFEALGENNTFEVTRDGVNYQTLNLQRNAQGDVYSGNHVFSEEPSNAFTQTVGASDASLDLDGEISRAFTLANPTTLKNVILEQDITGDPVGGFFLKIIKDDGGSPSTDINDEFYNKRVNVSELSSGTLDIDVLAPLPAGDFHLVLTPTADYQTEFDNSAGANKISFDSETGQGIVFDLEGREKIVKLRMTAGTAEVALAGVALRWWPRTSAVFEQKSTFYKRFRFLSITDNQNEFELDWFIDPRLTEIHVSDTGQVFSYPAFAIQGKKIIFPQDTFKRPQDEVVDVIAKQAGNVATIDNSDTNLAALAGQHFASLDPTINYGAPGRGIFLMRPDGIIREITINNEDGIDIYSV